MVEPLRILLVDDEPLAIERLQILCAALPGVQLVGTASDGEAALRLVGALKPDALVLDIAMPGLTGLDVARALDGTGAGVIFVTAYDRFAVEAFDVAAVDYLLKPVTSERLARAFDRVRVAAPRAATTDRRWTREFWVPRRGEMIRVAADDIRLIEAERDYMRLHVGDHSYLMLATIGGLEQRLDPERFVRLHRSTIVRRDTITRMRHDGEGRWEAILVDGRTARIGRSYLSAARALIAAD